MQNLPFILPSSLFLKQIRCAYFLRSLGPLVYNIDFDCEHVVNKVDGGKEEPPN